VGNKDAFYARMPKPVTVVAQYDIDILLMDDFLYVFFLVPVLLK
jgi:hypothetical protein